MIRRRKPQRDFTADERRGIIIMPLRARVAHVKNALARVLESQASSSSQIRVIYMRLQRYKYLWIYRDARAECEWKKKKKNNTVKDKLFNLNRLDIYFATTMRCGVCSLVHTNIQYYISWAAAAAEGAKLAATSSWFTCLFILSIFNLFFFWSIRSTLRNEQINKAKYKWLSRCWVTKSVYYTSGLKSISAHTTHSSYL